MPQIFQVLRCYNCELFQVHQVKKAKKWECKVCKEKQSVKKAYNMGSAPDCRHLVQQLNLQQGEKKFNELCRSSSPEHNLNGLPNSITQSDNDYFPFPKDENDGFCFQKSITISENVDEDKTQRYGCHPESFSSVGEISKQNCKKQEKDFLSQRLEYNTTQCKSQEALCAGMTNEDNNLIANSEDFFDSNYLYNQNILSNNEQKLKVCPLNPFMKKNQGIQKILDAAIKLQ